jgi:hypothetical protein
MTTIINYLGQIRLYSLADLILLLIAANTTAPQLIGAISMHIGFLIYLENYHHHSYRKRFPKYLWIPITILGMILYQQPDGLLFILFSYLYTKKNNKHLGPYSPLFRGLQHLFLIGGLMGYTNYLPWLACLISSIRNFVGDLRDIEKDRRETKTLPMVIGFTKNIKYGHLICLPVTSLIWWLYTELSIIILFITWVIQFATYHLTPRGLARWTSR